jgi:pantothenate kinase type III
MTSKSQILILGSSKLKFATFENNLITEIIKSNSTAESLKKLNLDNGIETLVISVKPDLTDLISAKRNIQIFDNEILPQTARIHGVYAGLGVDRLANLIGAASLFPQKAVAVLDLGTCNTLTKAEYSATEKILKFAGGFICPGVSPALASLKVHTASLPKVSELEFLEYTIKQEEAKTQTTSPKEAICEGVFEQTIALINKIQNDLNQQEQDYKLILTGGWSKVFEKSLQSREIIVEPNLALIGGNACMQSFLKIVK